MAKRTALFMHLLVLSACASPAPDIASSGMTAAQLLAQTACPHIVADAAAWVDHGAIASRPARDLHVTARFRNPDDALVVLRSPVSTADTLVLELRPTPAVQTPGAFAYSEPAPDPLYARIVFRCRGGDMHTITSIALVY
ncbi:MAG: hypothetical protein SGJ21_16000 [Alphaproteobacteria bacterium]|nr:hypothetical protein [Alphaproteobacteria bacterium]